MPLTITAAEQIFTMATSMVPIVLGKKLFFFKEEYTKIMLGLFGFSIVFQLMILFFVRSKITSTNNQTKFKYKSNNPMQEEEIEMTVYDYDLSEVTKSIRGIFFSGVIAVAVKWKFKSIQPMFSFIVGNLKLLLFSGLVREYVYQQKMLRPWDKNYLYGSVTVEDVVEIKEESPKKDTKKESKKDSKKESTSKEEYESPKQKSGKMKKEE